MFKRVCVAGLVLMCASGCAWTAKKKSISAVYAVPASAAAEEPPRSGGMVTAAGPINAYREKAKLGLQTQSESAALQGRMVVYTGTMRLLVPSRETAREQIEALVQQAGGYIVRASLDEIVLRVKPEQFKPTLGNLTALGNVLERNITSDDVTDEYTDTKIRQEVAEGSRKRLMELLAKAQATKDLLEIERDIRRLTEEIETMKGRLRLLESQVEMATITVRLTENAPAPKATPPRPPSSQFAWLNRVGTKQALADVAQDAPLQGGGFANYLRWKMAGGAFRLKTEKGRLLPEQFVPLSYTVDELVGSTADGHRLRVLSLTVRQAGDVGFWTRALEEELKARGYLLQPRETPKMSSGDLQATRLRSETEWAGSPMRYDVWLVQDPDEPQRLLMVDYTRAKNTPEAELKSVEAAVEGMRF
jgi:hypothetical protein